MIKNTDEYMDKVKQMIIEIWVTEEMACRYVDEYGDQRVMGNPNARKVIDLGDEGDGGWTARVIRYLRGDYLDDGYYSYDRMKKRHPGWFHAE